MNPRPLLAITAVAGGLLLSACHDRDHDRDHHDASRGSARFDHGDGAISMDGDKVVIEAGGERDKAIIGADGSLSIGGRVIDTSADGQAALKAYDSAAVAMKTHAIALGRTGAEFGVDVLKDVVRGFFNEDEMDAVGDRVRDGAQDLVASLRDLCTRLDTVLTAQQAAAAAVPAFKPYAVLEARQVRDCFEEIDEESDAPAPKDPPPPPAAPAAAGAPSPDAA